MFEVLSQDVRCHPGVLPVFINIQRRFDLNNTVYTYLLEKRSESGIARASNVSDNRIIDQASYYSSSLIKPKKRINLIIAIILGFIVPMAAIFLIDFFNDRIIDKKDIEKGLIFQYFIN